MKKIVLLAIIALLLNACRYVNPKDDYLDAKEAKPLQVPAGVDNPNVSAELDVPKAKNQASTGMDAKSPPPDMPIRTVQSSKGGVRIENKKGYAVLSAKTETSFMWQALTELSVENWTTIGGEQENCVLDISYNDVAARERKKANFLKRIFTRNSILSDYSGQYKLSCEQKGSFVEVKFSKADGSKPSSFLADNIMNALYSKFE